jgi:hypothetical protein
MSPLAVFPRLYAASGSAGSPAAAWRSLTTNRRQPALTNSASNSDRSNSVMAT